MEDINKMSIPMLKRELKKAEKQERKYIRLEKHPHTTQNKPKYTELKRYWCEQANKIYHVLNNKQLDIARDKGLIK